MLCSSRKDQETPSLSFLGSEHNFCDSLFENIAAYTLCCQADIALTVNCQWFFSIFALLSSAMNKHSPAVLQLLCKFHECPCRFCICTHSSKMLFPFLDYVLSKLILECCQYKRIFSNKSVYVECMKSSLQVLALGCHFFHSYEPVLFCMKSPSAGVIIAFVSCTCFLQSCI